MIAIAYYMANNKDGNQDILIEDTAIVDDAPPAKATFKISDDGRTE